MILGIGTDIIAVGRIERVLAQNPRFAEKVFSPRERAYCEKRANPAQSYAARFAAKEAVMKALGTGWDEQVSWIEIEVVTGPKGKPGIALSGATRKMCEARGMSRIQLSLSHEKDYAIAFAILEG